MNLYEELELSQFCTEEEIKLKYRTLASIHHPDKGGDTEKFKRIKLAYEVLSDSIRRKEYDVSGKMYQDPSTKSEAIQELSSLLNHVLRSNDPSTIDLLSFMRGEINNLKNQANNNIDAVSISLEKLKIVRDKLKFKKDSEDILRMFVDKQIEMRIDDLKNFKRKLVVCNTMLEILDDYTYGYLTIPGL
mgnify:CR=1 FL=1